MNRSLGSEETSLLILPLEIQVSKAPSFSRAPFFYEGKGSCTYTYVDHEDGWLLF